MISLKQIETLHWIATLGTFQRAAEKMNATQAAVSKRILELEESLGYQVLDRSLRKVRLTLAGEEVLSLGRDMLAIVEQIRAVNPKQFTFPRKVRLGITQLSAMTWLPKFLESVKDSFPKVSISVDVKMGRALHDDLLHDQLDIAVMPDVYGDEGVTSVLVDEIGNSWAASPLLPGIADVKDLHELSNNVLLTQGGNSAAGAFYKRWLKAQGVTFRRAISTDSLPTLAGMAVSKLGVAILPHDTFPSFFADKRLIRLTVKPELPKIPYAIMYKQARERAFIEHIGQFLLENCRLTGSASDT